MSSIEAFALTAATGYLFGSIPTALIVSRKFFGFDIRDKGSGNMGSTNAFRVLGTKWGVVVQLIDILKGLLPVLIAAKFFASEVSVYDSPAANETLVKIVAGISAVCGHIWTVFASFKGGKGINAALGALLGLAPAEVGIALAVFLAALLSTGYVSLGSILAAITLPLIALTKKFLLGVDYPAFGAFISFLSLLALVVIFAHRSNIDRLLKGKENRFEKVRLLRFRKKKREN